MRGIVRVHLSGTRSSNLDVHELAHLPLENVFPMWTQGILHVHP